MIDAYGDEKRLRQLPLDLQINEVEDAMADGEFIAPEEARRISEMARMALESISTREDGEGARAEPEWMEEYRRLRETGWPWRVACYIAWAASPRKMRWPKTQALLAQQVLGLRSDRQVGTWRKKNPVIDETITMLQAQPLIQHRRDIYEALIQSATNSDYKGHQDRELALLLLGDLVKSSEIRVRGSLSGAGLAAKSDEELRALMGSEAEGKGEE